VIFDVPAILTNVNQALPLAPSAAPGAATGATTLDLIRLFVILVGMASLVTLLARRINLPYTVALVAFGIVAGAVFTPFRLEITPELVLVVLLPALVFEASYQIDFDKLRPSLVGVSLLAGPGVLVSAALVALFLNLGAGMPATEAFIVGAMLAATDPAAVIATFKRLASPRRLSTLVDAESLFNDGTGIVAFTLAVGFASNATSPVQVGVSFVSVVLISAAIGVVAGWLASRILPNVGDHLIEVSLSVVLAYGTYLLADALDQSGVIATATAGLVLGNYGRRLGLSSRSEEALNTVWEFVAFLATAFVFLVVGFAISLRSLASAATPIVWAVAATFVGRTIIVYGLLGSLRWLRRRANREQAEEGVSVAGDTAEQAAMAASDATAAGARTGRRHRAARRARRSPNEGDMPFAWLHVIYWSGLRGAVSTALALSLPADMPDRAQLQAVTLGVVLFTLFVQATTAELVVSRWGHKQPSPPRPKADSEVEAKERERAAATGSQEKPAARAEPGAAAEPARASARQVKTGPLATPRHPAREPKVARVGQATATSRGSSPAANPDPDAASPTSQLPSPVPASAASRTPAPARRSRSAEPRLPAD
jgi:CPA1 family monovalent cation:H+ antiporter